VFENICVLPIETGGAGSNRPFGRSRSTQSSQKFSNCAKKIAGFATTAVLSLALLASAADSHAQTPTGMLPGQGATTVDLATPSTSIPSSYFGLHILHLIDNQDTTWPNVPFGTWRLWDSHVSWNELEPERGVYDFSLLDQYVAKAQAENVQLILTLAISPPWADNGAHGGTAPPVNIDDWQSFVDVVAHRYAGKIHYYEIWNEPDHSAWYSGTMTELLNMEQLAYTAIKAADSTNQVLSPPVDGDPVGQSWLEEFLAEGGGQYVDIFAFHFYVGSYPEAMVMKVQQVQAILEKYGENNKAVWNTEAGWPFYEMTDAVASDYVARAYIVNWALGLQRFALYAWDTPRLGIAPAGVPTPMTAAYAQIANWLTGSTMTVCEEFGDGVWLAEITLPSGKMAKLAWYPNGSTELAPYHVDGATDYVTLTGTKVAIASNGEHVYVSRSPILLEYAN
jgi:hypothetical protein